MVLNSYHGDRTTYTCLRLHCTTSRILLHAAPRTTRRGRRGRKKEGRSLVMPCQEGRAAVFLQQPLCLADTPATWTYSAAPGPLIAHARFAYMPASFHRACTSRRATHARYGNIASYSRADAACSTTCLRFTARGDFSPQAFPGRPAYLLLYEYYPYIPALWVRWRTSFGTRACCAVRLPACAHWVPSWRTPAYTSYG